MMIDDRWYHRPAGTPAHDAAGGVVVRVRAGRVEVALVRDGTLPALVLPKGHVEPGETPEAAARREVAEEAGLPALVLLDALGVRERLDFGRTSWKRTHYFLFMVPETQADAAARAEWFALDALPAMFWPEQHALLEEGRERIVTLATKAAVQAQFARQAAVYARSESHARDRDLDLLVEHLTVTAQDRVLDVATGTGFTAFALARLTPHVTGLDLTLGMLTEARRLSPRPVRWVAGDAEALPFPDGAFDVVTVRRALHHFPHLRTAMREMQRVLRPGGRLGIVDQIPPEDPAGRELMERLEKLRDGSHVEALPASRWRQLLGELGVTVSFSEIVERTIAFEAWLDLAGADPRRREAVLDALSAASPAARREIGDDGTAPPSFTKRWVVLVARR